MHDVTHNYCSFVVGAFQGVESLTWTALRTLLSKLVASEDQGTLHAAVLTLHSSCLLLLTFRCHVCHTSCTRGSLCSSVNCGMAKHLQPCHQSQPQSWGDLHDHGWSSTGCNTLLNVSGAYYNHIHDQVAIQAAVRMHDYHVDYQDSVPPYFCLLHIELC